MYWPVGTPRVYATSSSQAPTFSLVVSHDGLPSPLPAPDVAHSRRPPLLTTDSGTSQDSLGFAPGGVSPITPTTPQTPAIKSVEQGYIDDEEENEHARPIPANIPSKEPVLSLRVSRSGHLFATITATSMTIWQTKPTVILALVVRSQASLESYGSNVDLLLRPDSAIFVVHTSLGYLITYSLATDAQSQVYKPYFASHTNVQRRRQNHSNDAGYALPDQIMWGPGEGGGVRDASVRFKVVIKIDAGIESALALDDELVVATRKPAAVQCIRWVADESGNQTSTELLNRAGWLEKKATIKEMTHDRPMNLWTWITSDGRAYAVQRYGASSSSGEASEADSKRLFKGYGFHVPQGDHDVAKRAVVNARFSLIAVGCADGSIHVYSAKDYVGNIPPSHTHKLPVSKAGSGALTTLSYSPDGYCLFAGYEKGWATWSVYGKPLSHSFNADQAIAANNGEEWISGIRSAAWIGGASEILLLGRQHEAVWLLEMARNAVTGCYSAANLFRTVLQTNSSVMIYRGYDLPDLTTISAEPFLWHTSRIPATYLLHQWPIKYTVISSDGRYLAVAGRRGLTHYSVNSGRWKTFANEAMENEFQVRGGMCWWQNILVAAVEVNRTFELRLFSREAALDNANILHIQQMPAAVVLITPSGEDSLLVYTYNNLLYHFVFAPVSGGVRLVQLGHIAFHGIVRSPARVRGLSWILPESQLVDGDPSQDVAVASVLFLVDGKLVLLKPSLNEEGQQKYDMRVIAQSVEYHASMRDQPFLEAADGLIPGAEGGSLQNSLWVFDGGELKAWTDLNHVLDAVVSGGDLPATVRIAVDFYPLSILLSKGIVLGVEPDLVQRRDINFSFFRFTIRTHLFLPEILSSHLAANRAATALALARTYQHLAYFAHALEILLHTALDEEVDASPPPAPDAALLPRVLSLLSSFRAYLDIVVQCTRKTELRSWRTLFAYLPPPQELFEESLARGSLKTAGGYLLVLHTFDDDAVAGSATVSDQSVRLLARAAREGDWELCKQLARFLAALDGSGDTLARAVELAGVRNLVDGAGGGGGGIRGGGDGDEATAVALGLGLMVPTGSGDGSREDSEGQQSGSDAGSVESGTVSAG